jgi:hypothetical protein
MGGIVRWLLSVPIPWRRWSVGEYVRAADLVPQHLSYRSAAIVGPPGEPTWIAFDCPCGRGHRIMLNLDPRRRPFWIVRAADPLTISPSVDDSVTGRRCHFRMLRGRVGWVREESRNF